MKKTVLFLSILLSAGMLFANGTQETAAGTTSGQKDLIVVGYAQVGAESDWRTANTESFKTTFTEANGYKLILMMHSRNRKTKSRRSEASSSRTSIISYWLLS